MLVQMQIQHTLIDAQTYPPRQFQMTNEEAEQQAEQEDNFAEEIITSRLPIEVPTGSNEADGTITLQADQCSWCGFSDHNRKTKAKCPQHPQYSGNKYDKGAKVSESWISCSRSDHKKRLRANQKEKLTPYSVRSEPTDSAFTTKNWTEGIGALDNYIAQKFEGDRQTKPKAKHGWTIDTPPIEFFNYYHPESFRDSQVDWTNRHCHDVAAGDVGSKD